MKNKNCQISYDFTELGVKVSPEGKDRLSIQMNHLKSSTYFFEIEIATDLLQKMLEVNPKRRITAA